MQHVIRKSPIPDNRTYMVKDLVAPYFDPAWHFHPEYQLFVVLKGEGTRFVGDNIKPFKANEIVFTGPNLPHLWRNYDFYFKDLRQDHTRGIVIYFQPDFLGNSVNTKEEFENVSYLFQRSQRGLEITGETNKLISRMMIDLLEMSGTQSIIQLLKILDVLSTSSDCYPIANPEYINLSKVPETDRMSQIYEYVMKNITTKICLSDVADLCNMSISSFSRYFKSRANKSFSDFLTEIRIGHSCQMLHVEKMNICQISYDSGFGTLSNFNRQFKKLKGTTPFLYRRAYLESTKEPSHAS